MMRRKEKAFHKEMQKLRNDYSKYLGEMREDTEEFGKYARLKAMANNKFVELLIINEIAHDKAKKVI